MCSAAVTHGGENLFKDHFFVEYILTTLALANTSAGTDQSLQNRDELSIIQSVYLASKVHILFLAFPSKTTSKTLPSECVYLSTV